MGFQNRSKKALTNLCKELLEKYDRVGLKDVYKIVTFNVSWICAYEPETKQQSTMWVYEPEPNPTEVVYERSTSKQMVACFFGKTGHVATDPVEHRRAVNSE